MPLNRLTFTRLGSIDWFFAESATLVGESCACSGIVASRPSFQVFSPNYRQLALHRCKMKGISLYHEANDFDVVEIFPLF